MAEGIVIDVSARVTGYEQSLAQLKASFEHLNPGASISKSITRALQIAESKVKSLGSNLTPKITSNSQLDRFTEKINSTGDAIQHVASLLGQISSDDLDLSSFSGELDELTQKIRELDALLNKNITEQFREKIIAAISGIKIDDNASPAAIFQQLQEESKKAAKEVVAAEREMAKAEEQLATRQRKLTELQSNVANNPTALNNQVHKIADDYVEAMSSLREQMTNGLNTLLGPDSADAPKLLESFFGGLNPEDGADVANRIYQLRQSITAAMGKSAVKPTEIYQALFGKNLSPQAMSEYLRAHILPKNLDDVKAQLMATLQSISTNLTSTQIGQVSGLISSNDIDGALQTTLDLITKAYETIQAKILKKRQEVAEALNRRDNAQQEVNNATAQSQQSVDNEQTARELMAQVMQQNQALQEQNDLLKQELARQVEDKAVNIKSRAADTKEETAAFKVAKEEAEQYNEQLDKIDNRRQLVNHIEGIAQRWFSIYAAVRMAGNAIRSVVSTLEELDKTITNIAIVTDMTQDDLWSQMSTYTAMAKEYAVSISGVYEVSQLFYQQGLQTRDVMTLTGETLKMARIAGLDYAKATDFMTNALRSFKMENEEAGRVTDVYSSLAASAAISVSELANAMSKTASSAYAVGSSIEATSAMITVMVEATRESAENIGSAMKSIISRYGEMTSDPLKVVDSEGEEMSLNRVDKALQTVGITLQDANGQFRNFDEVIMELAEKWNTIDKNTQRYIATIMAGNRQQSRFLALVSSYDRLRELTATAMESEGAATSQFEKSLDGIEAKTQQLQTSLQNLYTSAGLQDLYSFILTIGSNVLDFYNDIAAAFGGGFKGLFAALATFSMQFVNVARVVMSVVNLVKAHFIGANKEVTADTEKEVNKRANTELYTEQELNAKILELRKSREAEITRLTEEELEKRAANELKLEKQKQKAGNWFKKNGSMIGSTIAAGSSIVGGMLTDSKLSSAVSGFGGLAGAAVQGFVGQDWIGAAMSLISSIGPLVSFFTQLNAVTDELAESTKKYQEAQEKAAQKRSEATKIKNEADSLKKLSERLEEAKERQYDSAEAKQEYLSVMKEIAEQYPSLVAYYDSEKNAIVKNTEVLDNYIKKRKQEAAIAEKEAIIAAAGADSRYSINIANANSVHSGDTDSNDLARIHNQEKAMLQGEYEHVSEAMYETFAEYLHNNEDYLADTEISNLLGFDYDNEKNQKQIQKHYSQVKDEFSKDDINALTYVATGEFGWGDREETAVLLLDLQRSLEQAQQTEEGLSAAYYEWEQRWFKNIKEYSRENSLFYEAFQYAKQGILHADTFEATREDLLHQAAVAFVKSLDLEGYTDLQRQHFIQLFESKFKADSPQALELSTSQDIFQSELDRFWTGASAEDYTLDILEYYQTADTKIIEQIDKVFNNLAKYSIDQLDSFLASPEIEDSDAATDLRAEWQQQNGTVVSNAKKAAETIIKTGSNVLDETKNFIDTLAPTYLSAYIGQLRSFSANKVLNDGSISSGISNIQDVWDKASKNDEELQILKNSDLTTLTSIYDTAQKIGKMGDSSLADSIRDLSQYIDINLNTELQTYLDTLQGSLPDLETALKNASSGMDSKAMFAMANRLGKSVSDFSFKDGKYYLNDFNDIYDSYSKASDILEQRLNEIQLDENADNYNELSAEAEKLRGRIAELRNYTDNYLKKTFLLQTGQIDKFLEELNVGAEVKQEIAHGDYTHIPPEYISAVTSAAGKTYNEIYDILIGQINGSSKQTTIKATDVNLNLLKSLGLAGNGVVAGDELLINWANATADQIDALRQIILDDGGIGSDERNNLLRSIYDSKFKNNRTEALLQVIDSYTNFDRSVAEAFASSIGETVEGLERKGIIALDQITGAYSMTFGVLQQQIEEAKANGVSDTELAKLKDAISTLYSGIANNIVKALEGSLSSTDAQELSKSVEDIFGLKLDFSSTAKGLGLSNEIAATLYQRLMAIDGIAARLVFDALYDSLTKSEATCQNISTTMRHLAEVQKEIGRLENQANDASKKRVQSLKDQYKLLSQIAYKQSMDSNSFKFLDRSLPTGYESPINYLQSTVKSFDIINQASEDGHIALTDFYNIVMEMSNVAAITGQTITVFGQTITGDLVQTSELIQKGFKVWSDIDGTASIGAEAAASIGLNFEAGVEEGQGSIESGIKAFAQQQIDMLNAMINALEGVAALEELETGTGDKSLGLGEVLKNFYATDEEGNLKDEMSNEAQAWITYFEQAVNENEKLKAFVDKIKVSNRNLITYLQDGNVAAEKKKNVLSHLYELMNSDDWGDDLSQVADKWAEQGFNFDTKTGFLNFSEPIETDVPLTLKVVLEGIDAEGLKGFSDLLSQMLDVDSKGNINLTGTMGRGIAYALNLTRTENGDKITMTVGNDTITSESFNASDPEALDAAVTAVIKKGAEKAGIFSMANANFTVDNVEQGGKQYIATENGDTLEYHKTINGSNPPIITISGTSIKGGYISIASAIETYKKEKQKQATINQDTLNTQTNETFTGVESGSGLGYEIQFKDNGATAAIKIGGKEIATWSDNDGTGLTLNSAIERAFTLYQQQYGSNSVETPSLPSGNKEIIPEDKGITLGYKITPNENGGYSVTFGEGSKWGTPAAWDGTKAGLQSVLTQAAMHYYTKHGSGSLPEGFDPLGQSISGTVVSAEDDGNTLQYYLSFDKNIDSGRITIGSGSTYVSMGWSGNHAEGIQRALRIYHNRIASAAKEPSFDSDNIEIYDNDNGIVYSFAANEKDGQFYLPGGTTPVSQAEFIDGIQTWVATNRGTIAEELKDTGLTKVEVSSGPEGTKVNAVGDYWAADGTGIGYYLSLKTKENGNVNGYSTGTIKNAVDGTKNWLKSLEEKYGSGEAIADALGAGKLVINPETNQVTMEEIPIANGYKLDYNLQITTIGDAATTQKALEEKIATVKRLQAVYKDLEALKVEQNTTGIEGSAIFPSKYVPLDLGLIVKITDSGVKVSGNVSGLASTYDSIDDFMNALIDFYEQKLGQTVDINNTTQVENDLSTGGNEVTNAASYAHSGTATNIVYPDDQSDALYNQYPDKNAESELEEEILDKVTQIAEEETNPTTEGTREPAEEAPEYSIEETKEIFKQMSSNADDLMWEAYDRAAEANAIKENSGDKYTEEASTFKQFKEGLDAYLNILKEIGTNKSEESSVLTQEQVKFLYENQASDSSIQQVITELEGLSGLTDAEQEKTQETISWLQQIQSSDSSQLEKMNAIAKKTRLPYTPAELKAGLDGISIHGDLWAGGWQLVYSDGNGGNKHEPAEPKVPTKVKAKGNTQAKGTLMGELGPELYVTGGHYYIAGQNGAEFVDLPDDAIVFNHLQTQRLMSSGSAGRGRAITNEKKATSYATGNVAMASASETVAKLRELRALWESLLNQDFKSLTQAAGGGGGGGSEEAKKFLYDLDRWYNLLRQIEKVEEQINYQQALRQNMQSGYKYVRSLEYELSLLEKEASNYEMLANLQESYYQARKADQERSIYSYFFNYDDEGLMQYRDEGFHLVADLNRTDETGQAVYTSEQQIAAITNALKAAGYDADLISNTLYYDEAGEKLTDSADIIQNFYDKFDGWIEEMDAEYDSFNEYRTKTQEALTKQNEILEEYRELQISLEKQLLEAIENREQKIIDTLQDEMDALKDASDKYLTGLTDALNKEQQMYQQNEKDTELLRLQRQLAILQRSGGSASEIKSLQDQINSRMQDRYFEAQQTEIDAIKEASDKQLEMMQNQIDLLTETLEYQKENGLLWAEVSEKMNTWKPEELASFVQENSPEFAAASLEEQTKTMQESIKEFEKWYEYIHNYRAFNQFYDQIDTDTLKNEYGINTDDETMLKRARATAKTTYQKEYQRQIDEEGADSDTAHRLAEEAALRALREDYSLHPAMGPGRSGIDTSGAIGGDVSGNTGAYSKVEEVEKAWNNAMSLYNDAKRRMSEKLLSFNDYVKRITGVPFENLDATARQDVTATYQSYFNSHNSAKNDKEKAAAELKRIFYGYPEAVKKLGLKLPTFDIGGIVDKTGPALVHAKEGVITPEQVDMLRKLTITSGKQSLAYQMAELNEVYSNLVAPLTHLADNSTNGLVIKNATVNMNVQSIANDYDARRAGEQALDEMMRIARKTGAQSIRR